MNTDRELLTLAAKAMGIVVGTSPEAHARFITEHAVLWFHNDARNHPACRRVTRPGNVPWNPADDDGDSMRLAVKLHMHLGINSDHVLAWVLGPVSHSATEPMSFNPNKSARRAILRCAAAIGKAMP